MLAAEFCLTKSITLTYTLFAGGKVKARTADEFDLAIHAIEAPGRSRTCCDGSTIPAARINEYPC
jgi:hypothetical protein